MQSKTSLLALIIAIIGSFVSSAPAQHWYQYSPPPREFDWQIWAPVQYEFLDGDVREENEGYFFNMGRGKFWIMRPERAAIGIANANVDAFSPSSVNYIYVDVGNVDEDELSARLAIIGTGAEILQFNAIDDAYSSHVSGWGNQYEFGWVEGYHGWMARVIQGVDMHNTDFYGYDDKRLNQLAAAQGLNGIDGVPQLTPDGLAVLPIAAIPGIHAILGVDGLLTVPVVFADPHGLLQGFADGTQQQLVRIAVVFDDMRVDNSTHVNSVELNAIRRKKELHPGGTAEVFFGARYLELDDRFTVLARGGTLADTSWDNHALNRIVGPQFGVRVAKSTYRWRTSLQGRFMAGANFLSIRQTGVIGDHLVNGQVGIPFALGGNDFFHRLSNEQFSPVGEFVAEASYLLTSNVSFNVAWLGTVVGGVTRSSNTVVYEIPQLGIRWNEEAVFTHGVTAAIEINR